MASVRIREDEGSQAQPLLLWDSIWQPTSGFADWAIADPDEAQNVGGLRAKGALHTAVIIALFTDKRMPEGHFLEHLLEDGADRRGWFGDGIDIKPELGEREMGSLLWIFERSYLTPAIGKWVEVVALEALQTLIFQGVAVRVDAVATVYSAANRCDLEVAIFGRDGKEVYRQRFDDIWKQTANAPKPLPFPRL